MAKIPQAGRCKTRLTPAVSHEDAAELSRAFVTDTIANVLTVAQHTYATGFVAYTPAANNTDLRAAFGGTIASVPQRGADFGARLYNTVADLLARGHRAVCVIDSDSPTLPPAALTRAVEACDGSDRVVLGPAADGGYYLLGLARPHRALFEDIAWSTPRVAAQTVARAEQLGLSVVRLRSWYDVDEPDDLETLGTEFRLGTPAGGYFAPATRAAFARLRGSSERQTVGNAS